MSAADIFRSAVNLFQPQQSNSLNQAPNNQPQGTQQTGQPNSANLPDGSNSTLEAGHVQKNGEVPGAKQEVPPLDQFSKLFDNVITPDKQRLPSLNADPTKLAQVASTLDFTRTIDPVKAKAALAGDLGAFAEILNQVGRQGFTAAVQASSHLVDRQSSAVVDHMQNNLPSQLKNFSSREALLSDNPALAHPAIAPILSVIQAQLTAQFPQASAAEIAAHAQKYLLGVVQTVSSGKANQAASGNNEQSGGYAGIVEKQRQEANNFDWGEWATPSVNQSQAGAF